MKKQLQAKDDTKTIKIIMAISLIVNISILISGIVFWVVLSNAGTNRYNQTTLRYILDYTDKQFCTGQGHEKFMKEIELSDSSPSDIASRKKDFDSIICRM